MCVANRLGALPCGGVHIWARAAMLTGLNLVVATKMALGGHATCCLKASKPPVHCVQAAQGRGLGGASAKMPATPGLALRLVAL